MTMIRTYSELIQYETLADRFKYLKLNGQVGSETFGYDRYINQVFYNSTEWRRAKDKVIIRDNGCDLGVPGYDIADLIIVHHMNPITMADILDRNPDIFNPEYLICTSKRTHNAIHYSDESQLPSGLIIRRANDQSPWRH